MNLVIHGAHACADHLLVKLRAAGGARVEVILHDDGQLQARAFRDRPVRMGEVIGLYRTGIRYAHLRDDLEYARSRLLASPRRISVSEYTRYGLKLACERARAPT